MKPCNACHYISLHNVTKYVNHTSGLSMLINGVISPPDMTSYDKDSYIIAHLLTVC